MERLVLTHIGKTGGETSNGLLEIIRRSCGARLLAFRGASSVFADDGLVHLLLEENNLHVDDFDIITGHVPFATARKHFMPARFATVLRDPRRQLISSYCSQPPHKALPDFGLGAFIPMIKANPTAEWALDNLQTRMLCDDPLFYKPVTPEMLGAAKRNLQFYYTLVGLYSNLDAFLVRLGSLYGMEVDPQSVPRRNVTGMYHAFVTDEHLKFAAKWNELDIDLYEWVQHALPAPERDERITLQSAATSSTVRLGPNLYELA